MEKEDNRLTGGRRLFEELKRKRGKGSTLGDKFSNSRYSNKTSADARNKSGELVDQTRAGGSREQEELQMMVAFPPPPQHDPAAGSESRSRFAASSDRLATLQQQLQVVLHQCWRSKS